MPSAVAFLLPPTAWTREVSGTESGKGSHLGFLYSESHPLQVPTAKAELVPGPPTGRGDRQCCGLSLGATVDLGAGLAFSTVLV